MHNIIRRSLLSRMLTINSDDHSFSNAKKLVVSIGNNPDIAEGVVCALRDGGIPHNKLVSTIETLAGRWEVGEDNGLQDLVASVKQEIDKRLGKPMISFTVVPPKGRIKDHGLLVKAYIGMSIADIVQYGSDKQQLSDYIECACSGVMACSTCHVIIDEQWMDTVDSPEEAEQDMLDLAYGAGPNSRLGCQLTLSIRHNGMIIHIPEGVNNIMDNIPFKG